MGKHLKVCSGDHHSKSFSLVEGEPVYDEEVPNDEDCLTRHTFYFCPLQFIPEYIHTFFEKYLYQEKFIHTAKPHDEEFQWVLNASRFLERMVDYYQSKF